MPCWSHRSDTGVCSRRWSRSMATFSGALKRFRVFLDMGKPPLEIVAYSSALFFPFRLRQNRVVLHQPVHDLLAEEELKELGFGDVRGQFDVIEVTLAKLIDHPRLVVLEYDEIHGSAPAGRTRLLQSMTGTHPICGTRLRPLGRGRPPE